METFKIAIICTPDGFNSFIREFYMNMFENPIYKIEFIEISNSEMLRGRYFNAHIIHCSSSKINKADYKLILDNINKRIKPI